MYCVKHTSSLGATKSVLSSQLCSVVPDQVGSGVPEGKRAPPPCPEERVCWLTQAPPPWDLVLSLVTVYSPVFFPKVPLLLQGAQLSRNAARVLLTFFSVAPLRIVHASSPLIVSGVDKLPLKM